MKRTGRSMLLVTVSAFSPASDAADAPAQREYHVSVRGDDANDGSASRMLKTITAAARRAQPGDVITVHEGVYRERVAPPRGGDSDGKRIVYQAAAGEKVEIKGSEVVKTWVKAQDDVWKATLPNAAFGRFNPYSDEIRGDWFSGKGRKHHTGAVYLNGQWLTEAAKLDDVMKPAAGEPLWFGEVDKENTTLWAQFKGVNPNEQLVEINARQTVFYPEKPGIDYITLRGFILRQAATPWAPPTAEQIGLVGTHWSKGWIIENNVISHSRCSGVALGKYGDAWDNKSASAAAYARTIQRALENGWSKEKIGHHVVRNNAIAHCEQAGIVGSLGAVFSAIIGNEIHDIYVQRRFGGAEIAGIKLHGAIDVEIRGNRIYRCILGLWLDWMAQGTRLTGNLLHDNAADVLFEVNHGPYLVDNNIFLSPKTLSNSSHGGAYAHNLIAGGAGVSPMDTRMTPVHKAHSTEIAGLRDIPSGDDRYYNNLFVERGNLGKYDAAKWPLWMAGNVYARGAKPTKHDPAPLLKPDFDPAIALTEKDDGVYLEITLDKAWGAEQPRKLVTSDLLGKTKVVDLPFERPDVSPIRLDTDYLGKPRAAANPFPGPFELPDGGKHRLKVWPRTSR